MKEKILRLVNFIRGKMSPVTMAIAAAAAVLIIGTVVFCVHRAGQSKKSPFDDMPVQIIRFPETVADTDEEDEGPDEEETFLSGKVENDLIKQAEKDKVLESPCILEYNEDNGFGYLNNCVFLGDSRTVGMVNYKCISDEDALAKVGLAHTDAAKTTFTQNSGKSYTVKQFLAEKKSDVVYVCYGVNGMDSIPEEKYEETYTSLVDNIIDWAGDGTVVLMSIWPVDDNGVYKGKVKNEWIDKYNGFLMKLAEDRHIHYLDVNTVLKDKNGSIKAEYDGGDGLHYSAYAYGTILDYIVTHPVPGVSDEGEYKVHYVRPKGGANKIPKAPATPAAPAVPDPAAVTDPTQIPGLEAPVPDPQQAEEEQRRKEEEERKRQEEEEEERKRQEEEQKKKEEEKKKQEEEEKKRQEEEERKRQEEEDRKRQEEEEQRRQEEERIRRLDEGDDDGQEQHQRQVPPADGFPGVKQLQDIGEEQEGAGQEHRIIIDGGAHLQRLGHEEAEGEDILLDRGDLDGNTPQDHIKQDRKDLRQAGAPEDRQVHGDTEVKADAGGQMAEDGELRMEGGKGGLLRKGYAGDRIQRSGIHLRIVIEGQGLQPGGEINAVDHLLDIALGAEFIFHELIMGQLIRRLAKGHGEGITKPLDQRHRGEDQADEGGLMLLQEGRGLADPGGIAQAGESFQYGHCVPLHFREDSNVFSRCYCSRISGRCPSSRRFH